MVPEVAIQGFDGHRGRVWLVQDGQFTQAELNFGARDDRGRVEVTDGVPDGAFIVALPPKGVSEGRRARIEDAL
jgi:HlyD family secretion protein